MREFAKIVLSVLLIIALIPAIAFDDWCTRIGSLGLALVFFLLILKLHFREDDAPDFLRECVGNYFNRNGFCFGFTMTAADGAAWMHAWFQNQRDAPCTGRIALCPARGFFLGRAPIGAIQFEIDCPPAGFGVVRIPIPLPEQLQGKSQSFEVGASVRYPQGKGRRLRFAEGILLRADAKFSNNFATGLAVAAALGGAVVLSRPATVTIALPTGVCESIPEGLLPEIKTLWQLGDSPFESFHRT